MAWKNFTASLAEVLVHEGGFTMNRKDPGNWTGGKVGSGILKGTKKGIAAASFPHLDIRNLTDVQIAGIYEVNYWNKVCGDDLPSGLDLAVFDYGVNSGPSRSVKDLQRVVGVKADGKMGPVTRKAVMLADHAKIIKSHCARRLSFFKSLAIWNTFGKGWSRRIINVEARALSWVLTKAELKEEAKKASQSAGAQAGGAVVMVPTGGVTIDNVGSFPTWLLVALFGVAVAVLFIRAVINYQRSRTLTAVAKEA